MRFCKKCKVTRPEIKWKKAKSTLNGKYYYRAYCNICLNKIRNQLREFKIGYKLWKKEKNRKYRCKSREV